MNTKARQPDPGAKAPTKNGASAMRQTATGTDRALKGLKTLLTVSVIFFALLGILGGGVSPAIASSNGRTFEMVSPIVKGGYGANAIAAVAGDGESVAFETLGGFDGALANPSIGAYLSQRGPSGWTTAPVIVPATVAPFTGDKGPVDYSPEADASISVAQLGPSAGAAEQAATVDEIILHPSDAPYSPEGFYALGRVEPVNPGSGITYIGASADFSRIFFAAPPLVGFLEAGLLPTEGIYELVSATHEVRMVGLNNEGRVIGHGCRVEAGEGDIHQQSVISDEGQIVFLLASEKSCGSGQVFARVGAQRTLEVSRPTSGPLAKLDEEEHCTLETVPCGATARSRVSFVGASADGSRVFFVSSAPLVAQDGNTEPDLYMASIGCPGGHGEECEVSQYAVTGLTDISGSTGAPSADVQGVVAVSPDGSRVYFVARGALSHEPNVEGETPVAGADNLYVYDTATSEGPAYIGDLCSGPERSGDAEDAQCPSQVTETLTGSDLGLWEIAQPGREAQLAGEDGRFLVFSCFARLRKGDSDTTKDVYRYDAESGFLQRLSIGEAGYDANGNDDTFNAEIAAEEYDSGTVTVADRGRSRAVTEDGSRVVFSSDGALAPGAVPGEPNVYEWRAGSGGGEGEVSLVAGDARSPVITPSGRDLFFATPVGLVPQDTDGAPDVYDARLGGGFPQAPVAAEPCSGDACQGPLTNPAPLLVPGSEVQAPGGNLPAPVLANVTPKTKVKAKAKAKAKTKRKRKKVGRKSGSGRGRGSAAGRSLRRGR